MLDDKPRFIPKNAITNEEGLARIEIIKTNRERKEQNLPYLTATEQNEIMLKYMTTTQTAEKADTKAKPQPTATDLSKQYGITNEALTSLLAMFSSKRQEAIAKASQNETQIILEFKDSKPPTLGEKPADATERFNQLNVHYNKVPWDIYEQIQKLQSEIQDLNKLKSMTLSTVDENGTKVKDPVLPKNNPDMTGLTDKEFLKINQTLIQKQQKLYELAGLWMYGLPAERTIKCETLTLSLAIEAGMYRLQFGYPSENPNYTSFLK